MRSIHLFFSSIALLPLLASSANPPLVVVDERTRNGNLCTVKTSLNCVYKDENGIEQPCLSETDKTPFLHVREDQCKVLDATVTMSICNMNTRADFRIRPLMGKSQFTFGGTDYVVNELLSDILPGKCIQVVRTEKLDTCNTKNYPMTAKLEGTMPNASGGGYCYGYAHRKNRVRHIPAPIQGDSEIFADCVTDNEESGHKCYSSVSISCTYIDREDGLLKSCVSFEDDVPFHTVRADRCASSPIDATLTMTMCNKNQNGNIITPYQPPSTSNYFRFNALELNVPDIYADILQNSCKTMTRQVRIDTCRKKWPMSVQLNANMTKSVEGNSYCYCYLFRKSVIEVFPAPPNPSPPAATKAPTSAPTAAATNSGIPGSPTGRPSHFPTVDVTSMPSSSPLPLKPIIITEIADPATSGGLPDDVPRFVEMYVPDVAVHGDAIKDNLKLVIFPGTSTEPDWSTAFDLKGKIVEINGFITLCNEAAGSTYIDACSYVAPKGTSSPVNFDGCYNIAIVEGNADEYTIVDMYGIPGRLCDGTISDFSDGRAVRLDNATFPNFPWDQYNWEVIKDEDIGGIEEPGDWNPDITPCDPSDIIITEVAYPNGLPSSRYVELYLPQCVGQRIKPGVKLVRWPEASGQPSINHVALQDVVVPKDGFIVICQSLAAETTFSNLNLCDVIGGSRTPLGTDAILVIDGPIVNNISGMDVIDSYGSPGASGKLSSDFTNGRAVRYRPTIPMNSGAVWDSDQWIVYPSNDGKNVVGPEGMDPRVWVNPIIITEITDPDVVGVNPADIPRFVEMYIPDDSLRMKPVKDNLKLVVFRDASKEPDWNTAFDLKGKLVNSKGFITLCNTAGGQLYDNLCDYVAFSNTAVNIDGCYNVGVVQGDSERYSIVDMYGIMGASCRGTITDFSDGRAVRLENTTYPESSWDQYNWEIIKGEGIDNIQEPGDWNPDIKPCDPRAIIITELSDPKNKGLSRYIELYLPKCAGQRIKPGIKLIRWPEGSAQPSLSYVELQDVVVPKDGFVLVCRSAQVFQTFDIDTCEIFAGDSTPSGEDAIAVVIGDNIQLIPSSDFIDSYGYPGSISGAKPLPSDFTNGRAVRLKPIIPSNSGQLWKPEQWVVYPGNDGKNPVGPEGMDPRVWINPVILTEITDPSTDSVNPSNVPRLVEMYFSDNHVRGKTVQDNLKLVVFPGAASEPDWSTAFDLKGKYIGTDGFITVCNGAGLLYYGQLCDFASSPGNPTPADNDGCYNVAIVQGDETVYNIVDLYGVVGVNCRGTDSDFSDGRAVRLTNATYPESSWEKYNWRIIKGADPDMADPHEWVDDILPSFCNLIITELASPIDNDNARYIELYSDNCAGRTIGDDFKVIQYDGGDGKPEPAQIDLEGMVIGDDGFLVLCTTDEANFVYDGKCDVIVGKNTPADNDGDESVAIVLETPSGDLGIVDIYGRPDRDGTLTDQDFTDGRAIRDTSATEASDEWNPDDWFIVPGGRDNNAEVDDMDPREWENPPLQIFITELADPSDTAAKRFIEIYTPNYQGKVIEDDLMLIRFEGDSDVPVDDYVCLKGMKFNSDGFMVFCRIDSGWPADKCQHKLSMDSVANVQGTDDVAIVRGSCADSSNYESIVDIFGVPGVGVEGPYAEQVFTRGRAVRRKDVDEAPKSIFDADDWMILPGTNGNLVDSEGCDPSEWNDFVMPDPLPDPPSSPSSSKGKGSTLSPKSPSKGKGSTLSPKSPSKGKGVTLSPKSPSKGKGTTLSPKSSKGATLSPKSSKGATLSPKSSKGATLSPKSPSKGATLSPKSPSKGATLTPKASKDKDTTLSPKPPTKTKTAAPKVSPGGKKIRNRMLEVHLEY